MASADELIGSVHRLPPLPKEFLLKGCRKSDARGKTLFSSQRKSCGKIGSAYTVVTALLKVLAGPRGKRKTPAHETISRIEARFYATGFCGSRLAATSG
jgi:hypothetical protein